MKLARIAVDDGPPVIGVVAGGAVHLTTEIDPLALLPPARPPYSAESIPWQPLLEGAHTKYTLLSPVDPPEVWACGFTFRRGPQFGRSPMLPSGPAYAHAIAAGRPEVFFKTTGFRVVGPNLAVGIRGDSSYTAVEPELCLILDSAGRPCLLTAGNDVSAWDIESQNPLWLAQCKTYEACCALGPVAVTLDEVPDDAVIYCRISREGKELFTDSVPLSDMLYTLQELADYTTAYNPLPQGSVIMTGTAIIRPGDEGLAPGDVTEVTIDGIGTLRNSARLIGPAGAFLPSEPSPAN